MGRKPAVHVEAVSQLKNESGKKIPDNRGMEEKGQIKYSQLRVFPRLDLFLAEQIEQG